MPPPAQERPPYPAGTGPCPPRLPACAVPAGGGRQPRGRRRDPSGRARRSAWNATGACLLAWLLAPGCGGGTAGIIGGSAATAGVISGTAAAGAPLIGRVTLKDSAVPPVTRTALTAADGTFSFTVTGLQAPFMLKADGQAGGTWYQICSAGDGSDLNGNLDITPYTDLTVALTAQEPAAAAFDQGGFAGLTRSALALRMATVQLQMAPILAALGLSPTLDLLHAPFQADHTGYDALLDVLKVTGTPALTLDNVADGSSARFDLVSGTVSGTLSGAGVPGAVVALQAILARAQDLTDLFTAATPPTLGQIGALGFFDPDRFLQDGQAFSAWAAGHLTTSLPDGMLFPAMALVSASADTLSLRFQILPPSSSGRFVQSPGPWVFHRDASTGNWLCAGDQRVVAVRAFEAWSQYDASAATRPISSGLYLDLEDPAGVLGADGYAVLSGPGLASATFTAAGSGPFSLGGSPDSPFLPLTDAQIGAIPAVEPGYSLAVYALAGGAPVRVATYPLALPAAPVPSAELSAANFAALTATGQPAGEDSIIRNIKGFPDAFGIDLKASLWDDRDNFFYFENKCRDKIFYSTSYGLPRMAPAGWTGTHGSVTIVMEDRVTGTRTLFKDGF